MQRYIRTLLLITGFFLSMLSASGQQLYRLSGVLTDESEAAIAYADVVLLQAQDSAMVKYTAANDGHFSLEEVEPGNYLLQISSLGYERFVEAVELNGDSRLEIRLRENAQLLDEVTVTAARDAVVNKNGNLKVTVDNSVFAAQPTTMDVLSMIPTVLVSADRTSLNVIGKGAPLIYLGNQRISIDELNALPVESIKDIEIINNPSARYEADGQVVLLINRKLNFSDGIRLELSETASFKRRYNNYTTLNASLKKNKLELKTNFAYNQLQIWERFGSTLKVEDEDFSLDQLGTTVGPRPQFVLGGGIYYQLNSNDYISINANYRTHTTQAPIRSTANTQEGGQLSRIETDTDEFENRSFFSSNFNYNKKLESIGVNLFGGLQYSRYIRGLESDIFIREDAQDFELLQVRDQNFQIDAMAGRIDLEKRFGNGLKAEVGTNIYRATADAFLDFQFLDQDRKLRSDYRYQENNYAFYAQISAETKRMNYTLGLRTETNEVDGRFEGEDEPLIDRRRTNLFPRLSLNYTIDSTKTLSLNYANAIRRPNYLNASSITTFLAPSLEYSRNANLQPTITNEASLNFQYKNQSIRFSYFERQRPVNQSIVFDSENRQVVMSPENFDRETGFNISLTSPLNYKFWTITNFVMLSFSEIKDPRAEAIGAKPFIYFYTDHRFRLPQKINWGISCWGLSDQEIGVLKRKGYIVLNTTLSKTFGNKWTAAIAVNDLFRQLQVVETYRFNQVDTQSNFTPDNRNIAVSLRYAFGKISKSSYQNKDIDEQLDRMR
ncbi:MAG: outer membrane beta-barrel family protein [Bacteroidota bacterium]